MSELSERIKMAERQAYFRAHEKEYPFPLDGSNWARLIREKQFLERHPHCRCDSCLNLLTRLHDKDTMLIRQRKMIMKAMHHWFIHDANLANLFWTDQLSAEELAKFKLGSSLPQRRNNSLKDTEQEWLANDTYCKGITENVMQNHTKWLIETDKKRGELVAEIETDVNNWLKVTGTEKAQTDNGDKNIGELQALNWEI